MLGSVFLFSSGQHIYMPLGNAIGMGFAAEGKEGAVLGRIQSANTAALVAGSGLLLLLFRVAGLTYGAAFSAGSVFYLCSAVALVSMSPQRRDGPRPRFVLRREYSRFYALSVLFGARKQLFITFGPWMIVDLFRQPVSTMTLLFFIVSLIGIVSKPWVGRLTDRHGARAVLGGEAALTVGLCLLYAFSPALFPAGIAVAVVCACYIADQATDAVAMTRAVYVKRIALRPEDVSPTLSLGISVDHVVSMTLPMLGGLVWRSAGDRGYRWVFLGGAAVAAVNFLVTRGMEKGVRGARERG
jgi:predicted MFS family arabinose efflux permease